MTCKWCKRDTEGNGFICRAMECMRKEAEQRKAVAKSRGKERKK